MLMLLIHQSQEFWFSKQSHVVSPDYFLTAKGGTQQFIRLTVGNDTVCTISIVTIINNGKSIVCILKLLILL